jgi:16S rRNA (cytidine1402-2'-O)-methyltransferase
LEEPIEIGMDERLLPGLYIVATPIGNLGDISSRAADTLREADLVLAEDKRVTAKLLAHIGAKRRMLSYNDHSGNKERQAIVERLAEQAVALVSDAGTPMISDPGYKLVRAAREAGHAVHTVPGPCAAIAALTLSALPTDRFLFVGFLPVKAKARKDSIGEFAEIAATLVIYESGPRLADSLVALRDLLGAAREAAVVREISKMHEECVTGSLAELVDRFQVKQPKGEIVIVVGPPAPPRTATDEQLDTALDDALRRMSPSRAAAEVAVRLNVSKKRAYARALERVK